MRWNGESGGSPEIKDCPSPPGDIRPKKTFAGLPYTILCRDLRGVLVKRKTRRVTTTYPGVTPRLLETPTSYFGVRNGAPYSALDAGKPVCKSISDGVVPSLNASPTTYFGVRNHVPGGKYRVLGGKKPRTSGQETTYLGVNKRVLRGNKPRTWGLAIQQKFLQNVVFSRTIKELLVNCSVFVYVVLTTAGLKVNDMRPCQGRTYG